MIFTRREKESICKVCIQTKQTKAPASGKLVGEAENITQHIDICGPLLVHSFGGNRYFMSMTTTPHRYTSVQLLRTRDEAAQYCYDHIAWIDRNAMKSVKRVRSNNAKTFLAMKAMLKKKEIISTTASAHTSESNRVSERMNRTLLDKVRSMLKKQERRLSTGGSNEARSSSVQ